METERVAVVDLRVDPARFQIRTTEYAETIALAIEHGGWREEKAGLFTVWQDPETELWVLDGHSRLQGIRRLNEECRPSTVRALVHRGQNERWAVELAKELNPSTAALTPSELAQVTLEMYRNVRAVHEDWSEKQVFEHISTRLAGTTRGRLRRAMPLAYLPSRVRELVDDEILPLMVGVEIGRFVDATGVDGEVATQIATNFIRAGMPVKEFRRFLKENRDTVERVSQSDMFGEILSTQFQALGELRALVGDAEAELRTIRVRREALEALDGTKAAPTKAQRALLAEDRAREDAVRQRVAEARERLKRATTFGVGA